MINTNWRAAIYVAVTAVSMVLAWQYATVRINHRGNWIGLFDLGNRWPPPAELSAEYAHGSTNDAGYDGVFYHMVSHDPWLERGYSRYADNASLRWRRILIPGLAHIVSLGRDEWVDACYIGVNLLFIFAGVFWLACYCEANAQHPGWGLAFLAIPSVLVSIDRLTIDTALAALTMGFILYASRGSDGRSLAVLTLCPLARETGLLLTAGQVWQRLRERKWLGLLLAIGTALPSLLWFLFVFRNTPRDDTPWLSYPLAGILRRTIHPLQYPITGPWVALAASLDYLALIGIWIALGFSLRLALKRSSGLLQHCIYCFAFAALWLGKADIWAGAYEFGRTLSPLLILLGLLAVRNKDRRLLLPLAFVLPRILLQYEPQVRGILRVLAVAF
ncbi:MAG TPA: hypothetical protein VE398_09840 [Acidobacteriota bacterium]|nr:hypothetical protein [Acidobacteriota bacterium]